MHYIGILVVLLGLTFATGGHSQTFGKAAEAVTRGEVSEAVDLLSTAVRRTLQDADLSQKKADSAAANQIPVDPRATRHLQVVR